MLLQFKVTNFLSFKEETTFSLMKGIGSELPGNLHRIEGMTVPSHMRRNFGILKSAFIYGLNGAGKSNLLKAVALIRNLVVNSAAATPNMVVFDDEEGSPFLFQVGNAEKPIEFEIMFEIGSEVYTYYVALTKEKISQEYLYKYIQGDVRVTQRVLFERTGPTIVIHDFDDKGSSSRVLHNSLALSKFASENSEEALRIHKFFNDLHVLDNISDLDYVEMFQKYGDEFKDFVVKIFHNAKLGISDIGYFIETVDTPENVKMFLKMNNQPFDPNMKSFKANISAKHEVYDIDHNIISMLAIPFTRESKGINKILKLAGSLFNVIKNGKILFFDEIDIALHPLLTRKIIQSLHAVESDKKFQFVFTTHDADLLDIDLLRRDQIWFAKRDDYGVSTLQSLVDFQTKRKDVSLAKSYKLSLPENEEGGTLLHI